MIFNDRVSIDFSQFDEDRDVLECFKGHPLIVTTLTSQFQEFARRYHGKLHREDGTKVFKGQVMLFGDVAQFELGTPSRAYPEISIPGNCYAGAGLLGDTLIACNGNRIEFFDDMLQRTSELSHPLFNDLHSLTVREDSGVFLVASSGIDRILEFEARKNSLVWQWSAYGDRRINIRDEATQPIGDLSKLHIPTEKQLAHINTASYIDGAGERIGVALFHQGELAALDRNSGATRVVLSGLRNPHGFQRYDSDYFVCADTRANRIIFFDPEQRRENKEITGLARDPENAWIQNVFPLDGELLMVLNTNEREVIAIHVPTMKYARIAHNPDWKIYQILAR